LKKGSGSKSKLLKINKREKMSGGGKNDETVKVVVRIRPMSSEEERNGNLVAAEAFPDQCMLTLKNPKANDADALKQFTFDSVFGPNVTQKFIYETCASSIVEAVLSGYNATFFAYGQTGSGKTHTMEGRPDPPHLRGIIPNSFQHIFEYVASNSSKIQFLVRASYLEIYNEEIRDLLAKEPKNGLDLKENVDTGVYVKDLTWMNVKNVTEIDYVMQSGKKNRSVGATLMNATSSRSHSIFSIIVECCEGEHIRMGKLNLVDLAGSERQSKTGATGDRLKEATKINFSLTALGNVINALVDGKSTHVPYRDSKLTRLLQNSLGGNAKTVMCANCGPADYNYEETLSTLRYANRAKNIKNKPKINEDPKDAMLREYQDEIERLKRELEASSRGNVLDSSGKEIPIGSPLKEYVERIVEREVVKEVRVGISEEEMENIRQKAEADKQFVMKQAQEDMRQLISEQSKVDKKKTELQAQLDKEADDKKKLEAHKSKLAEKLRKMEEQVIRGGEVLNKVNEQEAQLRKKQMELRERDETQARLARELAEKEEMNLQLEEHFSSLQEEVEVKSKKLKRLFTKYEAAVREAKDLQEEFQTERSDMLETIRQLSRTLKLKELVLENFVPGEYCRVIEKKSQWDPEVDAWIVPKLEISGARLASKADGGDDRRIGRPASADGNKSPVSDTEEQGEVVVPDDNGIGYPYLQYGGNETVLDAKSIQGCNLAKEKSSKTAGSTASARPKSAARKK
jgi:hypothetical protein